MPHDESREPRRLRPTLLLLTGLVAAPFALLAQDGVGSGTSEADSVRIVAAAREAQDAFERFRESRIPVSAAPLRTSCDERIGRSCIWFGGTEGERFPPEPVETALARGDLIGELYDALAAVRDPWTMGQLVHYLAEDGRLREAETAARQCDLEASWWCRALLGYVLHLQERVPEAEAAFHEALAGLPAPEAERWALPPYLLTAEGEGRLRASGPEGRAATVETLWRLSDPLYLIEGNDRRTEHFARLVEARNRSEARTPQGTEWDEDSEEVLVRYGRATGYSRVRDPSNLLAPGGASTFDAPRVVEHHDPASRGYLFPEAFLPSPSEVPPESWVTAPRQARTWYAPPYAPDFRALESQVATFRRDGALLVVGAFTPAPPERDPFASLAPGDRAPPDPFGTAPAFGGIPDDDRLALPTASSGPSPGGPVQTGFFLVPEAGGDPLAIEDSLREGVLTLTAPPGRYVSSLEVLEPAARRAWRARQGIRQEPLVRGVVAVSDLLLLREGAPLPETLDEAIPLARPGIRVSNGERIGLAWEIYGLEVEETVSVTLGFTSGRPGFLARVGAFLGILEPEAPIQVSFSDPLPGEIQTHFRAIELTLPPLPAGEHTLHLRLDLAGREPVLASRPVLVEP